MKRYKEVAYILAFFLGALGAHAFYYKKYIRGGIYLAISVIISPLIPVMVIVGWVDMFFIKRWHTEFYKENSFHEKSSISDKANQTSENELRDAVEAPSLNHTLETENQTKKGMNTNQFYNTKDHVLEKYAHIETPEYILEGIHRVLNDNNDDKTSGIRVDIKTNTYHPGFLQDSLYHNQKHLNRPVREIPLQAYWTTFNDLNTRQLTWYFYWRTQVLNKKYLDVDLSYIILFTYELMNYTFNSSAAFNVSLMETLYDQYKDRHLKLANYLPQWIGDMLYELKEPDLAKTWNQNIETNEIPYLYQVLEENIPLNELSMDVWNSYIMYGKKSSYFEENKTGIYPIFKKNLQLLEEFYSETDELLIDKWFFVNPVRKVHRPFKTAVMGRSFDDVHVPITYYQPTELLKEQVTAVMKISENISRKMNEVNYKVKVNEEALNDSLIEKMNQHFLTIKETRSDKEKDSTVNNRFKEVKDSKGSDEENGSLIPSPPDEVNEPEEPKEDVPYFDTTRIENLAEETNELVQLFDGGENEQMESIDMGKESDSTIGETVGSIEDKNNDLNMLFSNEGLEQSSIDDFLESLNEQQIQFLLIFKDTTDGKIEKETAVSFAKNHGFMLGVFVSNLNEKANEWLGDILIDTTEHHLEFYEDFTSVLTQLEGGVVNENIKA